MTLIRTAGHSPQDITVLARTRTGMVAFVGDLWWRPDGPIDDPVAPDLERLRASRRRVLELADLIVPGHGAPFRPPDTRSSSIPPLTTRCDHVPVDTDVRSCGSPSTRLVVVRGNSGSGKSTVASIVRERAGRRCALVGQDHFRRIVLWEQDKAGGLICDYLEHNVRFLLDRGRDVVLEGILLARKYGPMLRRLLESHLGGSFVFYLDITFEETVNRHTTRPQAGFTAEQMRDWYVPHDVLGVPGEHIIGESPGREETAERIGRMSGLWPAPAEAHIVAPETPVKAHGLGPLL